MTTETVCVCCAIGVEPKWYVCGRCFGEGGVSLWGVARPDVKCGGCKGEGRILRESLCDYCKSVGCFLDIQSIQCRDPDDDIDTELVAAAQSLLEDANAAFDRAGVAMDQYVGVYEARRVLEERK